MISDFTAHTESDVEQKIIYPVLSRPDWCGIPTHAIKTKEYIPAIDIEKGSRQRKNYSPDYVIYAHGFPVGVIETKSKNESALQGLNEARMYALALNAKFPNGINPVKVLMSCNGTDIWLAKWDEESKLQFKVPELELGSKGYAAILAAFGWSVLSSEGKHLQKMFESSFKHYPYEFIFRKERLNSRVGYNSFAEALAPVLRYYFQNSGTASENEILENAYVSTENTVRYERVFENFLRQRTIPIGATGKELAPTDDSEKMLTEHIWKSNSQDGSIQLLIGGVGAGKTSFIKRYMKYLAPTSLQEFTEFVYLDFNEANPNIVRLQDWVLDQFIDRFVPPGTEDEDLFRKIFGPEIQSFKALQNNLYRRNRDRYEELLADQKLKWVSNREQYAKCIARYFGAESRKRLVVVFDNLDKRNEQTQIELFEVAQWFKGLTSSLIIVSLRDTTWEAHKKTPPLDTLQNATHFYIAPPRFFDVAKKRLELARENIARFLPERLSYDIEGVGKVTYDRADVHQYLSSLYDAVFINKRLVGVLIESLAGRNVRNSLDMFTRIIQSGHLDENRITQKILKEEKYSIPEYILIRALMRQDYRFFTDENGFCTNILAFETGGAPALNLLRAEILANLTNFRKKRGDNGIEGYKLVDSLSSELELLGYDVQNVLIELNYLLKRGLVVHEDVEAQVILSENCVRIHAAGWAHLTILCQRLEYIVPCALVSPILDKSAAHEIEAGWTKASGRGDLSLAIQKQIATSFLNYLKQQKQKMEELSALYLNESVGSKWVIANIEKALSFAGGKGRDSSKLQGSSGSLF